MRTRGPTLTLLAVATLAFVLLAVNMTSGPGATTDASVRAGGLLGAATAPLAAPPPVPNAAFPVDISYAGRTSGRKAGEATVEIAIRNGTATAYLCDGKKLESWLEGPATGSSMTLRGKGTDELTAELEPGTQPGPVAGPVAGAVVGAVVGAVTVGGARWRFTAEPGKAPTAAKRAAKTAAAAAAPATPPATAPEPAIPQPATPQPAAPEPDDARTAASPSGGY